MDLGEIILLLFLVVVPSSILLRHRWPLRQRQPDTSGSQPLNEEPRPRPKTFRVRGVPLNWSAVDLQSFLRKYYGSSAPAIKSFALEIDSRSNTATATFQDLPVRLQKTSQSSQTGRISLPKSPDDLLAPDRHLMLDVDFLGITTLYAPSPEDHNVDIIAISGLGGHAFGSFKERDGDHMWLRDALPHDLVWKTSGRPMARVMIYGYESTVSQSDSFQNLEDLATSSHASLLELSPGLKTRPIILVAHSLGGLIVKQALISMFNSKIEADRSLIQAVYGIVFIGVPHDGMDISSLIQMVGNGPNRSLIDSLDRVNSLILNIQQRAFHPVLGKEGDSEVFCFYETNESKQRNRMKMAIGQ